MLEHAIARARRHELGVGVLYLDLDNFKLVNDSLGHHAGDELLLSTAMSDPDRTQAILTELLAWDLRLAIDDFGTGYSSYSRLNHLPVDVLKIDRTFVRGVDRDRDLGSMVQAMVQLAKNLDMTPLAEGIETAEALGVPHRARMSARSGILPLPTRSRSGGPRDRL